MNALAAVVMMEKDRRPSGEPGCHVSQIPETHDGFVAKVDFERALSFAGLLPLLEPDTGRCTAADYQISIKPAIEHRLATRIDRR